MTTTTARHLLDLGRRLIGQREKIYNLNDELNKLQRSALEREYVLIPADGWPGSNADKRDASRLLALGGDMTWVELDASANSVRRRLERARLDLQILLDERDAFIQAIEAERVHQAAASLFGGGPGLAAHWLGRKPEWKLEAQRRQHDLILKIAAHPPTDQCPDSECAICSLRDCPYGDALHYDDDGCPSCYQGSDAAEAAYAEYESQQEELAAREVEAAEQDAAIRKEMLEPDDDLPPF